MNILKNVSLVVVGAAIGVGATYKYFQNKFAAYADEEIESVKEMVRNRDLTNNYGGASINEDQIEQESVITGGPNKFTKAEPVKAEDGVASENKEFNDDTPPLSGNPRKRHVASAEESIARRTKKMPYVRPSHVEYDKIVKSYNADAHGQLPLREIDPDDNDENDEPIEEFNEEQDFSSAQIDVLKTAQRPYVITAQQFVDEERDFSKVTVTYFTVDDVLMDEDHTVIDMIDDTIGDESLACFGAAGSPSNLVYVRNENLQIDYEVIREDLSYEIDELGSR